MTAAEDALDNVAVERLIRVRAACICLIVGPLAFLAGIPLYLALHPGAHSSSLVLLGVPFLAAIGFGFGYFAMARGMIQLFVPLTISIDKDGIVGNFERSGWPGAALRRIRFAEVRRYGTTLLFRIPFVVGARAGSQQQKSAGPSKFYLTRPNFEQLSAALAAVGASGPGDLPNLPPRGPGAE